MVHLSFSRLLLLLALGGAASLGSAGCSEPRERVVLYVSVDEHVAREVIAAFERRTGVDVQLVTDTEAKKTTGLAERLRAEADHPQADVFWSSEIFQTIELAEAGIFAEHLSEATVEWPNRWRDPQRRWFAFAGRARVIVYAPDRVAPDELPETWMDLTDAQWKGRLVMADPRFGTTGGHLAAMKVYWDRQFRRPDVYYEAFLMGLAENGIRLLPSGNAGVVRAVADGEADLGLTDTDDVWAAQAQNRRVQLIYPRHDAEPEQRGGGTLIIPNTVARVRGGSNPQAAARLIDFLLSEEVEVMLAESPSRNIPLRPALAERFLQQAVPDPLEIDYQRAANERVRAIEMAMEWLDPRRAGSPGSGDAG